MNKQEIQELAPIGSRWLDLSPYEYPTTAWVVTGHLAYNGDNWGADFNEDGRRRRWENGRSLLESMFRLDTP